MTTVYVSIGNSDDKLTQYEWGCFNTDVLQALLDFGVKVHGEWYSHSATIFQNACWCIEVLPGVAPALKARLAFLAKAYRQDSIVWAPAQTEFIGPADE